MLNYSYVSKIRAEQRAAMSRQANVRVSAINPANARYGKHEEARSSQFEIDVRRAICNCVLGDSSVTGRIL